MTATALRAEIKTIQKQVKGLLRDCKKAVGLDNKRAIFAQVEALEVKRMDLTKQVIELTKDEPKGLPAINFEVLDEFLKRVPAEGIFLAKRK